VVKVVAEGERAWHPVEHEKRKGDGESRGRRGLNI
jgi:hypothetical protein